jgi:ferrochelatase
MSDNSYDAILYVSFGGPEGPDDVMPFLRNVVRGRNVPEERLQGVAKHYMHFDGVSPINGQNRGVIKALKQELVANRIDLPIYFGNRNWHPMLTDTMQQMQKDGVKRALSLVTSAFSSYSGCRQYRENIQAAQEALADPASAPTSDKIRVFYNHPLFVQAMAERIKLAYGEIETPLESTELIFTAHSIPLGMAEGCAYQSQLTESARLIAESLGWPRWSLCYQSRSGPPTQPWLEPDICDYLADVADKKSATGVIISPLGFLSDHVEVLFDLDIEARELCNERKLPMARAGTVGIHPLYIRMLRELIEERLGRRQPTALGEHPPSHDTCPVDCCLLRK